MERGRKKERKKCFPGEIAGLAAQKLISNITFGFTVIFTFIHLKCSMQASNFSLGGAKEREHAMEGEAKKEDGQGEGGGGEPNTHVHTHACTHPPTHTHTHARTHAHTHARAHTHTHTLSLPPPSPPLSLSLSHTHTHHRGGHEGKRGGRLLWLSASQMNKICMTTIRPNQKLDRSNDVSNTVPSTKSNLTKQISLI